MGFQSKQDLKKLSKHLLLPRSIHALYIYDNAKLRLIWTKLVEKYKLTNETSSNSRWKLTIHDLKKSITNDMANYLTNINKFYHLKQQIICQLKQLKQTNTSNTFHTYSI